MVPDTLWSGFCEFTEKLIPYSVTDSAFNNENYVMFSVCKS